MTQEFGGDWTDLKLDAVRRYFTPYSVAMSKQTFRSIYIDAFAGSGERAESGRDSEPGQVDLFDGLEAARPEEAKKTSVTVALKIEPPFDQYIFVEKNGRHADSLRAHCKRFRGKAVDIVCKDANEALPNICKSIPWGRFPYTRAAVFVDPYGMQVDWNVLEVLAQTKSVDLALLFPTGPIIRVLANHGHIPQAWQQRLDRSLGCTDWRDAFYVQDEGDLFGHPGVTVKVATPQRVLEFAIRRLKTIFPWVSDAVLPLRNSKNSVQYHLMFACANPSERAGKLFLRIASAAIKDEKKGRKNWQA